MFKKINKAYEVLSDSKNACWRILPYIVEQIISKNVIFITSDQNNLDFICTNLLFKKEQIHFIVAQLTADSLLRFVDKINNENITKYIFENETKKMLSHHNDSDLMKLLTKHYSHSFAMFLLERFWNFPNELRAKYLTVISIDIKIWLLHQNYGQYFVKSEISLFVRSILNGNDSKMNRSSLCQQVLKEKGWIDGIATDDLKLFIANDLISKSDMTLIVNIIAKRQTEYMEKCRILSIKNKDLEKINKKWISDYNVLNNQYNNMLQQKKREYDDMVEERRNKYNVLVNKYNDMLERKRNEYNDMVEERRNKYNVLVNKYNDMLERKRNEYNDMVEERRNKYNVLVNKYNDML